MSDRPAWLDDIPKDLLSPRNSRRLLRWLDARHLRLRLDQLEAERAARLTRATPTETRTNQTRETR